MLQVVSARSNAQDRELLGPTNLHQGATTAAAGPSPHNQAGRLQRHLAHLLGQVKTKPKNKTTHHSADTTATASLENDGSSDCDNDEINPAASELANGIDDDCDEAKDEGTDLYDNDGDGYCGTTTMPCTVQPKQVHAWGNGDCDDTNADVHPNADELCLDGLDNNCSGEEDEEDASDCVEYYRDWASPQTAPGFQTRIEAIEPHWELFIRKEPNKLVIEPSDPQLP